jgi:hypothetical protein
MTALTILAMAMSALSITISVLAHVRDRRRIAEAKEFSATAAARRDRAASQAAAD